MSKKMKSGTKKTVIQKKQGRQKKSAPVKKSEKAFDPHVREEAADVRDEEKKGRSEKRNAPSLLRGMKDILPKESFLWEKMRRVAGDIANAYNFSYMETPVLEEASLWVRSLGKSTDVVEKEMYAFEDKDGTKVALRPEPTAGIVRAYVTHGLQTESQPVKAWIFSSMFRHDRPQAGRYREFHQFGCESLGVRDPAVDAELISVAYHYLFDLGIETTVKINSIGTPEDRANYSIELVAYLRSKRSYLSEISKARINKNPLRVLDSKEEQDQQILEEAPQIIDWLSEDSKKYFTKVLEYLDELAVPYILTPTLVRGLDYYTDTVFELYADTDAEEASDQPAQKHGSRGAIGGGGRYDLLAEQLGGLPTPACGFGIGLERVALVIKDQMKDRGEAALKDERKIPIFFAQLGEQARMRTLYLIEILRKSGIFVHHNVGKTSLKAQLEIANKFGTTHSLILGQKEVLDGTVIIRDMESGIQEIVDQKKLVQEIRKIAPGI